MYYTSNNTSEDDAQPDKQARNIRSTSKRAETRRVSATWRPQLNCNFALRNQTSKRDSSTTRNANAYIKSALEAHEAGLQNALLLMTDERSYVEISTSEVLRQNTTKNSKPQTANRKPHKDWLLWETGEKSLCTRPKKRKNAPSDIEKHAILSRNLRTHLRTK